MPASVLYIFVYCFTQRGISDLLRVCLGDDGAGGYILSRAPLHNNQNEDEMKASKAIETWRVYRRGA